MLCLAATRRRGLGRRSGVAAHGRSGERREVAQPFPPHDIGPLDTLIAAHALALGAVLVTHNTREFTRVPKLTVEDWA